MVSVYGSGISSESVLGRKKSGKTELSLLPLASTRKVLIIIQFKNSIVLNDTRGFIDYSGFMMIFREKSNLSFFPGQKSYADVMKIETL